MKGLAIGLIGGTERLILWRRASNATDAMARWFEGVTRSVLGYHGLLRQHSAFTELPRRPFYTQINTSKDNQPTIRTTKFRLVSAARLLPPPTPVPHPA